MKWPKPVTKVVKSRWYLCAASGEMGTASRMFEVQSRLGSYPSYTAADRVLHEDDPDAVNKPGYVLQRLKAEYKHLRPVKGQILLTTWAKHWRLDTTAQAPH